MKTALLSIFGVTVLAWSGFAQAPSTRSEADFYAYYTRLDYDDHGNTGQYADLVVQIGTNGRFVFCREFISEVHFCRSLSHLPRLVSINSMRSSGNPGTETAIACAVRTEYKKGRRRF